ncbi:type I DNA topoisomerase [Rhizomicrobium electricum]|uniref:DNA topoisomerase 1 n=1 Tax=Rhizomicrobium electricum TaxID=480070 RepID=A0ABN1E3D7_9PROT|nr:type I DNA topoisomerase [Rhizomicrobium electricum]NIJ47549.1 DNA topoisomerase-1 [Rhizomicrobium electricum]
MNVLVVESPAKAKTINKYLGPGYKVLASFGHIRDLPAKDGSVRPDEDFAMDWHVDERAQKRIKDIVDAVKTADKLILATDPDREGEAISWHVLEVLKQKKALGKASVERVTFNAITKNAVLEAIANPRQINGELVDAYLARRALDYLVGFTLSPVLWRKLPGARSAGRVQSVALRLVVDRELEIEKFKSDEYWTVDANVLAYGEDAAPTPFTARLTHLAGKKLDKLGIGNEADAKAAVDAIKSRKFTIGAVESKPVKRHPAPPFITSTLQQEASRKLGFSAKRTMQIAQHLYEGVDVGGETVGLITYMRTDGVTMDGSAIQEARAMAGERYGAKYVPHAPRQYTSKAKNAQEAHEAIRPTSFHRTPESVAKYLDAEQAKLYELIWKRAIASQMESAEMERTTVDVVSQDGQVTLRATGSVVLFDGFLTLYQEGHDDEADEDGNRLPRVAVGNPATIEKTLPEQHFTEPPPRYSEASLVRKLEELGIGRPSTYASILSVLRERAYVRLERGRFIPEDKGRIVTAFLTNFFTHYVEYDFTADLEEKLDEVSAGSLNWKKLLEDFWRDFSAAIGDTKDLKISQVIDALNEVIGPHIFPPQPDGTDPRVCPTCGTGKLSLKLGRFGSFVGCSNYPECRYTRQLGQTNGEGAAEPKVLGKFPGTEEDVSLRSGRFGPYVQLGEADKPKRAGLPKGTDATSVTLDYAVKLLSLPREVGIHPETQKPITANFGRFGPYVAHDGAYASLETPDDVFTIGLNHAVTILAEKKARGGRRGAEALKELGNTAEGVAIKVMKGRYGPYVTDGTTNATIPNGSDPNAVTLEQALTLIAERAAKGPSPKQKKKAEKAAKAAAKKAEAEAKKTAKPKAEAKKPAAKKKTVKKKAAPKKKSVKAAAE